MIRILHFGFQVDMAIGIRNQLSFERSAAASLEPDFLWDTKFFTSQKKDECDYITFIDTDSSNGILNPVTRYFNLRFRAFEWLKNNRSKYDILLLRYSLADPIQYIHSFWFKNVFTIHHSLEIGEAGLAGGGKGFAKAFLEKEIGKRVIARTKGIIGVTNEIARYENARAAAKKPTYCYPSGIDLETTELAEDERTGILKLLIIASTFAPWHGLDRLINTLKLSQDKFELHIVGNLSDELVKYCADDGRFIIHGLQNKGYIHNLTAKCDLAFGSFALDLIGMTEACTLKAREYLASGLPVYASDRDSALSDAFPFYRYGVLEATTILDYANTCRKFSREEVRTAAAPFIDKKILMRRLAEWISKNYTT
ncbi:MAG: hypothetical protein ABSC11_08275 [Smithella sp.]|jgi:glycosyltransferase involved in cell wall biosynthesis